MAFENIFKLLTDTRHGISETRIGYLKLFQAILVQQGSKISLKKKILQKGDFEFIKDFVSQKPENLENMQVNFSSKYPLLEHNDKSFSRRLNNQPNFRGTAPHEALRQRFPQTSPRSHKFRYKKKHIFLITFSRKLSELFRKR